jgi:hypothetical protein
MERVARARDAREDGKKARAFRQRAKSSPERYGRRVDVGR